MYRLTIVGSTPIFDGNVILIQDSRDFVIRLR